MTLVNVLKRKAPSKNFSEEKKNTNCHAAKRRKANDQTTSRNVAIVNAVDEVFDMHRRFVLKIALKVDDRKDENFTAAVADEADEANEANEANEKEIDETTVIDEAVKEEKVNKATTVDDEAVNEEDVAIAKSKYLTKIFSTVLVIIIFNS